MADASRSGDVTRRAVLAAGTSLGVCAAMPDMPQAAAENASTRFPADFVFGVAASAAQTESRDGRGRSNWDVFADTPGRVKDGSDNRTCTAFEKLYDSDIKLVADAGLKAFRFSVSWPRVQPTGTGAGDRAGLDFYERLIDALLIRGIEPWPTLFHWDIPAALNMDWRDRDLAYRFADYVKIVGERLGDRIHNWILLNEPNTVAVMGYAMGFHAPGTRSAQAMLAAAHHQNLAQGLGYQALRASLRPGGRIGTSLNIQPCRPAGGLAENEEAARTMDDAWNRLFLNPLFGKSYPERFVAALAELIKPEDADIMAPPIDFLGVNYYSRFYMRAAPEAPLGIALGEGPPGTGRTDLGWGIEPDGLEEALVTVKREYRDVEMIVTEFGAFFHDPPPANGLVQDPKRIDFIRRYLISMHSAIQKGASLKGALYWTVTDNWEWAEGFTPTFGLAQLDRGTLARIPKQSLFYFGDCAKENRVV